MDATRALLDSLMGQSRNEASKDKRKDGVIKDFKHDSVCKLYLVGFCPEHEKLFHNTRRDLGECSKTHLEIHKREFEEHPKRAKYEAAYSLQLLHHLTAILRRCDEWITREKRMNEQMLLDKKGHAAAQPNIEASHMKEKASKLLAEAEDMASNGDIEGSKAKVAEAQEYEKKVSDWEQKGYAIPQICEVCGGIRESEKRSAFKHEEGKVHKGILNMQQMLKDLKKREKNGELKVDKSIEDEERDMKDRDAKERKEREREKRDKEREERKRREKEEKEREAKERADREKQREERAREQRRREREEKERKERQRSRSRSRKQEKRSRDRDRDKNDRGRDRDRRESPDGAKKKSGDASDAEKDEKVSTQERNKQRAIQKQFMDLLVKSRAVTATSTYKDLEKLLGDKDEWKACDPDARQDLATEFIDCIKNIG